MAQNQPRKSSLSVLDVFKKVKRTGNFRRKIKKRVDEMFGHGSIVLPTQQHQPSSFIEAFFEDSHRPIVHVGGSIDEESNIG